MEEGMPDPAFDVFLSYKSEYLPWVEVLARNLQRQGLTVWLDDWQRVPGDPVGRSLEDGLNASRAAVLVVTPEAAQSGWVQSEYEQMRLRQRRGDGFRCIPLFLQASEGFAFLHELFAVDFRKADTPILYRRRLHELVCGLRGMPAGSGEHLEGDIEHPPRLDDPRPAGNGSAFDRLLDDVEFQHVAAAFAQEGAQTIHTTEALLGAAQGRFRGWDIHHLVPLVCDQDRLSDYFAHAGQRLGIPDPVSSSFELGRKLSDRLTQGGRHLLVVSHMENGPEQARRDFCVQLRQILDQYWQQVSVLFIGGERLDELVFHSSQAISLLNNAAATGHDWPEPDLMQVRKLPRAEGVCDDELGTIIQMTGGEPRLIAECLRRRTADPSPDAYAAIVWNSVIVRQWFAPFAVDPTAVARICRMLDRSDLGFFDHIREDELKRRLYWKGAFRKLSERGLEKLVWRCEPVRDRGRKLLQCDRS
jgi:hypothetical protein